MQEQQEEPSQMSSCCHTALAQSKCLLPCWSTLTLVSCRHKVALEVFCSATQENEQLPWAMRRAELAGSFEVPLSVPLLLHTDSPTGDAAVETAAS
ncbi:hypothetical protein Anapl_14399 [Anas platyrhynchos]|uniref:Uncharacterized protein n=1 Tax=Anas platyrhynchos TaxID=8839 RepID=R0JAE9_ANAPL|nr:hypothetical protein Anapl_14399 [Anas platyrhynchos]